MAYMISASFPVVPKTWTVMGHIDATARDLEPFELSRVTNLGSCDLQEANVVMQMRRARRRPVLDKIVCGGLMGLSALAVGGGLYTTAFLWTKGPAPIAPIVSCIIGGFFAGVGVGAFLCARHLQGKAPKDPPRHYQGRWSGERTIYLTGNKQPGMKWCEFMSTEANSKPPDGTRLGQYLADTMAGFPAQNYAFILGGHGTEREGIGGVTVADMARATELAHQASGRPLDVMVLDACKVGNFETLLPMIDHVRYTIASEEILYTDVIDWNHIVGGLVGKPASPVTFLNLAMSGTKGKSSDLTLSVISMRQLPQLKQATEALSVAVNAGLAKGLRPSIEKAFGAAIRIQGSQSGTLDMGSLLQRLRKVKDRNVRQTAKQALKAYHAAVIRHSRSENFKNTTGLSIQGPVRWHNQEKYTTETGMPAYSQLLQNLR